MCMAMISVCWMSVVSGIFFREALINSTVRGEPRSMKLTAGFGFAQESLVEP